MDATTPPPNKRPSPQNAAAARAMVARRWQRFHKTQRDGKPKNENFNRAPLRVKDLQTWFRFSYGCGLSNDDAGCDDIEILINYAVMSGKPPWPLFQVWTPWLSDDERERIVQSATCFPIWHDDDELARKLGIRYEQRQALGITSFSSVDVDLAGCKRLRRQRDNQRKRQERAATKQDIGTTTDNSPIRLTQRQRIVLEVIGDGEIAVPSLVDRLTRRKAFRGASVRQRVHEALDQLGDRNLVADRDEPSPQGGKIRFVWRVANDRPRAA